MELKAGKTAKIVVPRFPDGKRKIHVDYILENPEAETEEEKACDDYKLIVYRVWLKHRRYFKYYIEPYYVLCIYNNWDSQYNDL